MQPINKNLIKIIYQEIFSDVDSKMKNPNNNTEVNDPVIRDSFNATRRQIMKYLKLKSQNQVSKRNSKAKILFLIQITNLRLIFFWFVPNICYYDHLHEGWDIHHPNAEWKGHLVHLCEYKTCPEWQGTNDRPRDAAKTQRENKKLESFGFDNVNICSYLK